MNSIRKQDFAILVISDNYLKSAACMYEVVQLLKDDNWLNKTMIMLGEEVNIFGLTEQLNYIAYWNEEYTKLSDMIKQLPPESVSAQAKELKKISRIKDEVGSFLHIVSDRNIPAEDVYTQINLRLEQYTVVDKESSMKTVRLGSDAIALLISTCNASGMMCISSTLESYSISIDNTNFVDCSSLDNRTIAR